MKKIERDDLQEINVDKNELSIKDIQEVHETIFGVPIQKSQSMIKDISDMHRKFKTRKWVEDTLTKDQYDVMYKFLKFRLHMIQEEVDELNDAIYRTKNAEEIVDALVDITVFTLGTLDLFGINTYKAWREVMESNMSKSPGVKDERPNPLGLPDMIKPKDWVGPEHRDNVGYIEMILKKANRQ